MVVLSIAFEIHQKRGSQCSKVSCLRISRRNSRAIAGTLSVLMRYHGMAVMKRGDCKRSFYGAAAAPAARRLRLRSCSEQHLDACGQRHFQRTSEQDAYCAHTHACASRSRSHAPQKREEYQ